MSYVLECPGNVKKQFTRRWSVFDLLSVHNNFTDSASYRKALCTNNISSKNYSTTSANYEIKVSTDYEVKVRDAYEPTLSEGNLTVDAYIARFYTLRDLGVVVISTEDITGYNTTILSDILLNLNEGFQDFARRGIKKVVLDLSNNGGGVVEIASYILLLLFPDITPLFPADDRLTDLNELAISTASNSSVAFTSLFSTHLRLLANNKQNFTSIQQFFGDNYFTRGGVRGRYSTKYFFDIEADARELMVIVQNITGSAPLNLSRENLIILTNGFCGSACAMIAQLLVENKQIKTVAVGGLLSQEQFSYTSCPGGVVLTTDQIFAYLNASGLNSSTNGLVPNDFPLKIFASMPIDELYSSKLDNVVLEYLPRPSDYRLYYDEQSIRDPSRLWVQAANFIGENP